MGSADTRVKVMTSITCVNGTPAVAAASVSSPPRCAGRIVVTLGLIAQLLTAPLRGAHRRHAGFDCATPHRPAARGASSSRLSSSDATNYRNGGRIRHLVAV